MSSAVRVVLAIGGPGVAAAMVERGLVPVTSAEDGPVAVVQGYGLPQHDRPMAGARSVELDVVRAAVTLAWQANDAQLTALEPATVSRA